MCWRETGQRVRAMDLFVCVETSEKLDRVHKETGDMNGEYQEEALEKEKETL